jgi:mannose-6-phosphate isomerase
MSLAPFRLLPTFSPRPWGRRSLEPWYSAELVAQSDEGTTEPIGEAWLTGPQSRVAEGPLTGWTLAEVAREHTGDLLGRWRDEGEFPLLLKLLFPDDKLSVQVHPDDEGARQLGQPRGKTECWYVVDAKPGATVACGIRPGVTHQQMREAIAEGTLEILLLQIPVEAGDLVFVDAGTVHAIGPGVTLLETQQTSDTTFRIFDYGRPRELHVEQGLKATKLATDAGKVTPVSIAHGTRLVQQRYFTVDRFTLRAGESLTLDDACGRPHCLSTLEGAADLHTDAASTVLQRSSATVVPACASSLTITAREPFTVVRSMP